MIENADDLTMDVMNANKGTDRGAEMIEKSLSEFGAGRSIVVDQSGQVIAGNKTLEQAKALGLPIRTVETDGSELVVVQRTDLDLSDMTGKARRLAIADNRTSEVSLDWDDEVIQKYIDEGVNLEGLFDDDELKKILHIESVTEPKDLSGVNDEMTFRIVVECDGEEDQAQLIQVLESKGYTCQALMS